MYHVPLELSPKYFNDHHSQEDLYTIVEMCKAVSKKKNFAGALETDIYYSMPTMSGESNIFGLALSEYI
jgi:hypothetical protein